MNIANFYNSIVMMMRRNLMGRDDRSESNYDYPNQAALRYFKIDI